MHSWRHPRRIRYRTRRETGVERCKDRSGAVQESELANALRMGEPTACRKRWQRSAQMRRRAQPYEFLLRFAPKTNAHKDAGGLPPRIHAWAISNPSSPFNAKR